MKKILFITLIFLFTSFCFAGVKTKTYKEKVIKFFNYGNSVSYSYDNNNWTITNKAYIDSIIVREDRIDVRFIQEGIVNFYYDEWDITFDDNSNIVLTYKGN